MIRIAILLFICLTLCSAGSASAEDFFGGLSRTREGLHGTASDAGQAASGRVTESGVTEWAAGAAQDISAWANDSGLADWANDVQGFIDENGPALETWLARAGEEANRAWDTLVNASEHTESELKQARDTLIESLEAAGDFYILPITDSLFERIEGKSFRADCTLPREDLRYLHVRHVDQYGDTHEGEMIVNVHIAQDMLDIFRELYAAGYPIEKIRMVDDYGADDGLSMADNNTSSFNFRFISNTNRVSKHGLGLAVDINPFYNPYMHFVNGRRVVEPIDAEPYMDRDASFPYKVEKDDLCYRLFTERGFKWGGEWKNEKDYQHFEIPTDRIQAWYP